ncbi:hypothetical protein JCM10207_007440 [Rhodosporidiobolus poonsookiae]
MDWDGPRTQPSFWTPSLPPLERRMPMTGWSTTLYRLLRLSWVLATLPLHLFLTALSLLPLFHQHILPSWLSPGKKQRWTPAQRLVYPLLRRLIWAVCDIGSPGALTPAEATEVPLWGWALEVFTVYVGGGAKVTVQVKDGALPKRAEEDGWVKGEVRDPRGKIGFESVPLFWFEREGEERTAVGVGAERWKARGPKDRVIVYFVGGGFVTGNPAEGSRCFKLARETGLRVVGANFRKATTPSQAFPAALQDALATYAHLVLNLGYTDIVLAGDSAGAGLALNLLQYLALVVPSQSGRVPPGFVLPSGLLLYSPWCDLTASTYEKATHSDYVDDIICASMATNSIRSYLQHVHHPLEPHALKALPGGNLSPDSVYTLHGAHPWFSPSLPSGLPALTAVAKAYLPPTSSGANEPQTNSTRARPAAAATSTVPPPEAVPHRPLRLFITTGKAELFFPEVHNLISNLRAASRAAAVASLSSSSSFYAEPFLLEAMEQPGEVHAFPLVPEWIPNAHPRSPSRLPSPSIRSVSPIPRPEPNTAATAHAPSPLASPPLPTHTYTHARHYTDSPRPWEQNDIERPVPTVVQSIRNFIFSGYLNVLLVAVPLSFLSHFLHWGSTADFIISFIAIVPLASLLGDATEQCSIKLGQTVGGLLNATFGNAVELIVGILALIRGELRIVQTSLLGSILSNLLLVLGCSFLAGGVKFSEQTFQQTAAQASSSLMVLAVATLVIPAAYHASQLDGSLDTGKGVLGAIEDLGKNKDLDGLLKLSRGTAIILLFCYAAYLFFQLRSHAYLFEDPSEHEEEEARMNIATATGALVVVTVITSFCADYLVGAIDEFAQDYSIPKAFIGLILLPIVGNAAEHVTSVWMAAKGKMELTIGVAVGSSIQIAVGLIPILVLVGWIINQDLTLFFENFETIVLFVSVLLVDILVSDGRSNYLEGLMLIALYIVIALAFWVS